MSVNVVLNFADRAGALAAAWPIYSILLGAMLLDLLTGTAAAIGTRTLSSNVSWKGMMKKLATLMVVALAVLLEPIVPGNLALGTIAAIGFIVAESLSVLENAGRLGVLPPILLKDALLKLQQTQQGVSGAAGAVQIQAPPTVDLKIETRGHNDMMPGGKRKTDPPASA